MKLMSTMFRYTKRHTYPLLNIRVYSCVKSIFIKRVNDTPIYTAADHG